MPTLPIDKLRDEFDAAWHDGHVVVEAPTASGKSTRLPLWCAERGPVLIVEPRRMAARSLARHVAELRGSQLGTEVGYAVRFDARYGANTQAVFVTPGVALRWLAGDGLAGYETIILDEFHERRWDTDLLAARLRHEDRHHLVITSATVAGQRLARYLSGTRLEAEGRTYPVEKEYSEQRDLPRTKGLDERVAKGVKRALKLESEGDVLVFLPGKGEIAAAEKALRGQVDAEVVALHAGTDARTQDAVLKTADHRRVILATNVAETSLTLPGVRAVVDSGLERRTHHRGGRTALGLHVISQAAADQRAGRAGRLGPGHCVRLWGREALLEDYTPPEIAREELTELYLAAAAAGTPADELEFPDPLPDHAVQRARQRLRGMAAIDDQGHLTEHGARLFPLPLDPLFAHLVTAMPDAPTRAAMADLAAALSADRCPLADPRNERQRATLQEWQPEPCDAETLVRLLRTDPPADIPVRKDALREARRLAGQIRAAVDLPDIDPAEAVPREALLRAIAAATPELAFVRRAKRRFALGNGVGEVELGDSHLPEEYEAAIVLDQHAVPAQKGTTGTVNFATRLAPVPLHWLAEASLGETEDSEPHWDDERVVVTRRRTYANRTIATEPVEPEGEALRAAVADLILASRLFAGTKEETSLGDRIAEEIAAWDLYVALGHGSGEPVANPRHWLVERLEALGVEHSEDLALIEADDLAFDGIPAWERSRFDKHYPRRLNLEGMDARVHYDPHRKRITVEKTGGRRTSPPKRAELPAWSGWTIQFRDGSRLMPVG